MTINLNHGMAVMSLSVAAALLTPSVMGSIKPNYTTDFNFVSGIIHKPTLLEEVVLHIEKEGDVAFDRIKKDAKTLQGLGMSLDEKDLFYLVRVVCDESGIYYGVKRELVVRDNKRLENVTHFLTQENKDLLSQDMESIVHNIINRHIVSTFTRKPYLRGSFGGPTLYEIIKKPNQYSITLSPIAMQSWDEGFLLKRLTYAKPKLNHEKAAKDLRNLYHERMLLAYQVVIKTLEGISKNPLYDPTGGSLFYKSVDLNINWDGKPVGKGNTRYYLSTKGQHDHYSLKINGVDQMALYRPMFAKIISEKKNS